MEYMRSDGTSFRVSVLCSMCSVVQILQLYLPIPTYIER